MLFLLSRLRFDAFFLVKKHQGEKIYNHVARVIRIVTRVTVSIINNSNRAYGRNPHCHLFALRYEKSECI